MPRYAGVIGSAVGNGGCRGTGLVLELRRMDTAEVPQASNAAHAQPTRLMALTTIEEPVG
jgi:hypothetical protein